MNIKERCGVSIAWQLPPTKLLWAGPGGPAHAGINEKGLPRSLVLEPERRHHMACAGTSRGWAAVLSSWGRLLVGDESAQLTLHG